MAPRDRRHPVCPSVLDGLAGKSGVLIQAKAGREGTHHRRERERERETGRENGTTHLSGKSSGHQTEIFFCVKSPC